MLLSIPPRISSADGSHGGYPAHDTLLPGERGSKTEHGRRRRTQTRKDDSVAAAAGVKRSPDTACTDADALPLSEQFASSYMQRSHGTIDAGLTRGQGRSSGITRATNNLLEGYYHTNMSYGIETRTKAVTSMGVISCGSTEASLSSNYIPINATTECYRSNFGS